MRMRDYISDRLVNSKKILYRSNRAATFIRQITQLTTCTPPLFLKHTHTQNGMHVLAEVMKRHGAAVEVLLCVLTLQSQLAFEKENILTIVQYGGIDGILECIRENRNVSD